MRIAFLFNYPLVDNTPWKQQLIRSLVSDHELVVIFGETRPQDYIRTYLRKRQTIRAPGGGAATRTSTPSCEPPGCLQNFACEWSASQTSMTESAQDYLLSFALILWWIAPAMVDLPETVVS
jgi:hypothetical protein